MTHYLVTATPIDDRLDELRERLDADEIEPMRPFGPTLQHSLENARLDPETGRAVWEEEDHCSPPLRMEKEAVLDRHFTDVEVEVVEEGEGWERIVDLPGLWEKAESAPD